MKEPVAAAVVHLDGKILITRRAPGQKLAGMWEFPGGKLERGETPQDCIIRELREELGVESVAGEILTSTIYTYPGGTIELIAVRVDLKSTQFTLQVHDLFEWVRPQELLRHDLAPADIPIAEEIIRTYG
ncbi:MULTISPECIES: (deoxy)nucleoside triphosphate pyrophosphohydrolase [Pseudomonas]|uniref:(deoxy)nucleoside triphosphate pyrophosphohydrolase n=1 Tax=Pseudomonas TaxID=286 RepID=UPI0005A6012A|nr:MULTISPECIES: (deoxy)nucleoside triphosphate pyrophosphohydrolase [Pseudomonas]KAB0532945.1 (deoxy)nucleoside triphosphate pyrophosphohydrolase [Pseudomonas chlororaphis subsp. aureofaciens]TSD26113.1 (deoxy)nucleoside triphosphate pyrophosphohydrolase [Pseudomonas sp. ATCC 13985]WDG57944.1 (deoxy)nucleoside triphosphate pyrophosphohydrolase [Pseudomonas chlororaphis]WDG64157.1 (deoxy)nucleoside triphosphate pyrophosphohydrolase [Pseudomonas chlororaphis]